MIGFKELITEFVTIFNPLKCDGSFLDFIILTLKCPFSHQKFRFFFFQVLNTRRKALTFFQILFVIQSFQNFTNISSLPLKGLKNLQYSMIFFI